MNDRRPIPSPFLVVGCVLAGIVAVGLPYLVFTRFKTELAFGVLFLAGGLVLAGRLRRHRLALPSKVVGAFGFWTGVVVGHVVASAASAGAPASGKVAAPNVSPIDGEKASVLIVDVVAWVVGLALIFALVKALVGGPWSDKSAKGEE